jgi:dihydroorotate dehydrogenase electron transfer subunit
MKRPAANKNQAKKYQVLEKLEDRMTKQLKDRVVKTEKLTENIHKLTIESEHIASTASAGQFVNVLCSEKSQAILRRPISICSVNRAKGRYDIVFQVKGIGTELLAQKKVGDGLDVIGPLGKGFDIDESYKSIAVVGGGIGIFPLLFLLAESKADVKNAYLGFRNKELVVLEDEFSLNAGSLMITTDDGSYCYKGFITDLIKKDMEHQKYDMIYSCGPIPMLKKISRLAEEFGTKCQISLEQRMGCGFGACLVCACKTKTKADDNGWQYSHVCKDGPVFNSSDIIWE